MALRLPPLSPAEIRFCGLFLRADLSQRSEINPVIAGLYRAIAAGNYEVSKVWVLKREESLREAQSLWRMIVAPMRGGGKQLDQRYNYLRLPDIRLIDGRAMIYRASQIFEILFARAAENQQLWKFSVCGSLFCGHFLVKKWHNRPGYCNKECRLSFHRWRLRGEYIRKKSPKWRRKYWERKSKMPKGGRCTCCGSPWASPWAEQKELRRGGIIGATCKCREKGLRACGHCREHCHCKPQRRRVRGRRKRRRSSR